MVKTALALALALAVVPAYAQQKNCEELKAEIDAKITKNGVTKFTTTIVAKDAAEDGKVVGTCEGGSKKIVYKRGG
jgi:outer membrane lipoprotein-sorting protein